jgi:chemotaxis protein CheZ
MTAAAPPGQDFSQRLAQLRGERGDTVALTDVAEIARSLMESLQGDIALGDARVRQEIGSLVTFIENAKRDIAAAQPGDIPSQHIPTATDELDAIVKATEAATQAILDVAEKVGEVANQVGGEHAAQLNKLTTMIFEASNFQDITGQRITKVVRTLREIERKVIAMAHAVGQEIGDSGKFAKDTREGDAKLLNGPQLPQAATSQSEIDALFG